MVARANQCVMALTPVKLPRLIRWTALWPGLYTPATATKPIDEPPRDTCRNSPAMPRVTVHPPMSAGLNGPSEAVKGGCRGVWWDSNRARVRVRVCVCAGCGIMRVCATWPSDSPSPRKRVGGSVRPPWWSRMGEWQEFGIGVVRFCGSCDLRVNARTMV